MIPKTKSTSRPIKTPTQTKKERNIWPPVLATVLVLLLSVNGYIFLSDHNISDLRFGKNSNALSIGSWFDSLFHDTTSKQEIAANTPVTQPTNDQYIPPAPAVVELDTTTPVVEQPAAENTDIYLAYETFAINYAAAHPYLYFPQHPVEETIAASELTVETPEAIPAPESETIRSTATVETGFFVIGGMFCKERNARRFLKSLTALGFTEAQLLPSKSENCQRVSYKKFATKREAESYCTQIKAESNPEAWVLEVF